MDVQQQAYLNSGGQHCPACGSEDIAALGGFEADINAAWQRVVCEAEDCKAEWNDLYTLTGFSDLIVPEKADAQSPS